MGLGGVRRRWLAAAVVAALIGGGLSWPSVAAQEVIHTPCEETITAPAKPTGLTATLNPSIHKGEPVLDSGILLTWDAPAAADQVYGYDIYRREVVQGTPTTLRLYLVKFSVGAYHPSTGTYTYPDGPPTDIMDYGHDIEEGKTYAYAIKALRYGNCSTVESEMSDEASETYTAPVQQQSGGI